MNAIRRFFIVTKENVQNSPIRAERKITMQEEIARESIAFHEYPAERGKLFKIIKMLYGLIGLRFSDEASHIHTNKDALEYFIFSFIIDFGDTIKDYIAEEKTSS